MNESFLNQQIRTVPENGWLIGVVLLVCLLFVLSRLLFPRYHSRISYAFFNQYEATKMIEEKNVLFNGGGMMLNLVPLFCLAMLVFVQRGFFHPELLLNGAFKMFLKFLLVVVLFVSGRITVITLFGLSFEKREIALRFNQIWLLQFQNLGIYLLIPTLILPYSVGMVRTVLLVLLWAALILWVFYMIYRELILLKSFRVSIFYMFLYLCTLEILPLWWVIQSITEGW